MVNGKRFFDRVERKAYRVYVSDISGGEVSRAVNYDADSGIYIVSPEACEVGEHENLTLTAFMPLTAEQPGLPPLGHPIVAKLNADNQQCLQLFVFNSNRITWMASMAASRDEDDYIVRQAYELLSVPDAHKRSVAALAEEVEPILTKIAAMKFKQGLEPEAREKDFVSWRVPFGENYVFFAVRNDKNGVPFLAIQRQVPDDYFYNHAWFHVMNSPKYENVTGRHVHINMMARDLDSRLHMAFAFNTDLSRHNLGLRMLVMGRDGLSVVEQRMSLLGNHPIDELQVLCRLNALVIAYDENKLFAPQKEPDTSAKWVTGARIGKGAYNAYKLVRYMMGGG